SFSRDWSSDVYSSDLVLPFKVQFPPDYRCTFNRSGKNVKTPADAYKDPFTVILKVTINPFLLFWSTHCYKDYVRGFRFYLFCHRSEERRVGKACRTVG